MTVRYYLDTNIFIYALEYGAGSGDAARRVFAHIGRGTTLAATSLLTLGEVPPRAFREANAELERAHEALFSGAPGLEIVPVTDDVLRMAARQVATSKLRLPDAIHVASAIHAQCDALLSEDTGIRSTDQLPVVRLSDPTFAQ